MGGGLVQLVSNKSEDTTYLIGNPEISCFQIIYRRHTNFAIESQEVKFISDPIIGTKITAFIPKDADLCSKMYLEVILPTVNGSSNQYIYGVGNALLKEISIDIGGTIIDTHYNQWLNIWSELTIPCNKREAYDRMVGNKPNNDFTGGSANRLYIPLMFWFNNNISMALPLLALQNNLIKLHIQFASYSELTFNGTISDASNEFSCKLYIDYIFLDNDERVRLSAIPHEYLIEQVQFSGDTLITSDDSNKKKIIEINAERPIKELIWVHLTNSSNEKLKYSADIYTNAKININGFSRFIEREPSYFRLCQNYQCHTNIPRITPYIKSQSGNFDTNTIPYNQYIYTYSFALKPEDYQPSGHCNFSKIDKSTLVIEYPTISTNYTLKLFATNYNILRFAGGSATLIF